MDLLKAALQGNNLLKAAVQGNNQLIIELLNQGVDVNSKNSDGVTALMFAVNSKNFDTFRILLEKGADVNFINSAGYSILDYVLYNLPSGFEESYNTSEIIKLLIDYGVNVNHKSSANTTPLMLAVEQGKLDIVKLLLDNGSNPFDKDITEKSAIDYCRVPECKELISQYIWKKLYQRDKDTAQRYNKSIPISKDIWEIILLFKRQQMLCKNLSSDKNREVLLAFAMEFDMPVTKDMTKGKLCGLISRYLIYGNNNNNDIKKKIENEKNQIRKISQYYGLDPSRPINELLIDLSHLI